MRQELYDQLQAELEAWHQSQHDQPDGYAFEQSFVERWRKLGQNVLQESLGEVPKSRNQKKSSTPVSAGSPARKPTL